MRVAVVGSRRHPSRKQVEDFIATLPPDTVVVSGGATGPDTWAVLAATSRGLASKVHLPVLDGAKTYFEKTLRFYDRNRRIVEDSDTVVAFVMWDRTGGTENTVDWARKLGKPLRLIYPPGNEAETAL